MRLYAPSDRSLSDTLTTEEFICLRYETRNLVLPCPNTFQEARALATRIFPALAHKSFGFHTNTLHISAGDWVEVPEESWAALRPALSSLVIRVAEPLEDQSVESIQEEEEVHRDVNVTVTSETPSVVSPSATLRIGPPVGRTKLTPSASMTSVGKPASPTVVRWSDIMPTGSQHIDFPTSPIRDIKSEMGPPPSLTSPVKRPSTDFAMDNPVGTSPDSSRKRQRFTETPSGDDRAMDISDASTPKITSLSQRVASQASARAASRASASNERFSIYVYPPGGVNAKRKPKTLQVKKTTTVSKIVKSACDAFKFVNKKKKYALHQYSPDQHEEYEELPCNPEDTVDEVLWQGTNFILVPLEEHEGTTEDITFISD